MLRHSVSQVFGDAGPPHQYHHSTTRRNQEESVERARYTSSSSLAAQTTRQLHHHHHHHHQPEPSIEPAPYPVPDARQHLSLLLPPAMAPRTQIEAMPPGLLPFSSTPAPPTYLAVTLDAASRHPVFFSERLKRAPVGVPTGYAAAWMNPAAHGYVFNDGARGVDTMVHKL